MEILLLSLVDDCVCVFFLIKLLLYYRIIHFIQSQKHPVNLK